MFSVLLLIFFSSFLLLALLPDYLFFREVGFDWLQGGHQRFDWRRGGRQRIVRALPGRSVLCLFCSLFSSTHCACFMIISFFAKINNTRAGMRPDRTNTGGDRNAGQNSGSTGACHVILFVLYSIYFFFSLFFFSNWLCRHRPNCVSANFSKYWMVWIVSETVMELMSIAGEMN